MTLRSETVYQSKLIKKLKLLFPGIHVLKNNPDELQGVPDLLLLYEDRWAMLEVKLSSSAGIQPNQKYYVDLFNEMSFASFVYPEVEGKVLDDLQYTFGTKW